MGDEGDACAAGDGLYRLEGCRRTRIGRMGKEGRRDEGGFSQPFCQIAFRRFHMFLYLLRRPLGIVEVEEAEAGHGAHARSDGSRCDLPHEEIAVAEGGRPRTDHLGDGERARTVDHFGADVFSVRGGRCSR